MSNIKNKQNEYKKILLKEFFIKKVLEFFYTNSEYKNFVFTGWTCLRILYDLPRLSEDIDMDLINLPNFDTEKIQSDIIKHFDRIGWFVWVQVSVKSQWRTFNIKIPILKKLWLAKNNISDSDLLYIKIDTTISTNPHYKIQTTPYFKNWYSFVIKHYDLPSLFAGKLTAIFGRWDKLFHDKYNFKWRDFFDLIRYLQNWIKPNFERLKYELQNIWIYITDMKDFINILDQKIRAIASGWIEEDLQNLIESDISIKQFSDNFLDIFSNFKDRLLV